jgi:tRNA(Ile)-lysidine synthase
VRPRQRGERFAAFGAPGERRIKSVLSDEGVPRWERARVPILEANGDVVWVVGVRRGAIAPVGPETKRILEVTVFPL